MGLEIRPLRVRHFEGWPFANAALADVKLLAQIRGQDNQDLIHQVGSHQITSSALDS